VEPNNRGRLQGCQVLPREDCALFKLPPRRATCSPKQAATVQCLKAARACSPALAGARLRSSRLPRWRRKRHKRESMPRTASMSIGLPPATFLSCTLGLRQARAHPAVVVHGCTRCAATAARPLTSGSGCVARLATHLAKAAVVLPCACAWRQRRSGRLRRRGHAWGASTPGGTALQCATAVKLHPPRRAQLRVLGQLLYLVVEP